MSPARLAARSSSELWVPPEEAPHQATLMQWPTSRRVYRDASFLRDVQNTILNIANTISQFEPVKLLAEAELHAKLQPRLSSNVSLWPVPTDDLWCRDSGPLFAKDSNNRNVISHIRFNGWGGKQVHQNDGAVARRVSELLGVDIIDSGLRGEAGGVEHDGHGRLIAHESSWVNRNRNPGLSREEIGERLCNAYGAEEIIWSKGLKGRDITDYHIDSLARFTGASRVLVNLPRNVAGRDPFHQAAVNTHQTLVTRGLEVEVIPEPDRPRAKGRDFVASYVNYYVCNGAVICPQFGDQETDAIAQKVLARHYPDRDIVQLNSDNLGWIGGGIHCATQQIPA
ncbi:agmatine deiminase family protein [Shimia sediminis]|uniref:agmatine deiminase family protein n=1 Tax=Shimia sediminis TaxID=2497945 RepID=UPI000F8DA657|nr:agmatine deiminase family protein [Shimia sediminis]